MRQIALKILSSTAKILSDLLKWYFRWLRASSGPSDAIAKIIFGALSLCIVCLICILPFHILSSFFSPPAPQPIAAEPQINPASPVPEPTNTPLPLTPTLAPPTNTPPPTSTPAPPTNPQPPTFTPVPFTATPAPTPTLGPPTATPEPATEFPEVADTAGDEEIKAEANAIFQELQGFLEAGRQMEPLRSSDDLAKLEQCGNQMRQHQQAVKTLRDRAELLPLNYVMLKASTIGMDRCVSCSLNALEYCDIVASDLKETEQVLTN